MTVSCVPCQGRSGSCSNSRRRTSRSLAASQMKLTEIDAPSIRSFMGNTVSGLEQCLLLFLKEAVNNREVGRVISTGCRRLHAESRIEGRRFAQNATQTVIRVVGEAKRHLDHLGEILWRRYSGCCGYWYMVLPRSSSDAVEGRQPKNGITLLGLALRSIPQVAYHVFIVTQYTTYLIYSSISPVLHPSSRLPHHLFFQPVAFLSLFSRTIHHQASPSVRHSPYPT